MRPPYVMREVELAEPLASIELPGGSGGAHVLLRLRGRPVGRIWLSRSEHGATASPARLAPMIAAASQNLAASLTLLNELNAREGAVSSAQAPPLTVAVCTRDRAASLRRCLRALVAMRDARRGPANALEIIVVDNAPPDELTRSAVAEFPGIGYEIEPVPGLDMARNRAVRVANTELIGFVDDDAVVDRGWLEALAEAVRGSPGAAAFTGPVLPLMLETEAQLRFERSGGFGKGFGFEFHDRRRWEDPIHPLSAGRLGTGTNMVFSVDVLRKLGGFDEALDTGPPLPGGGDLDMFYRILRAGHRLVYSPGQLVHHEHRRDMCGLRRQYHSWGLAVMALHAKNRRTNPAMRDAHGQLMIWWWARHAQRLARSLVGRGPLPPGLVLAQLLGGLQGYFGEYRRSQERMARRKREFAR